MSPTTTDWPYDARPGDITERFRIPIVGSPYPRWNYIICVVVDEDRGEAALYHGVMPTEDEFRLIRQYLDCYLDYWYRPGFLAKMAALPFDIDGGANGIHFLKKADGTWCYHKRSWEAATFWPGYKSSEHFDLAALINHCEEGLTTRWRDWQAAHPLT